MPGPTKFELHWTTCLLDNGAGTRLVGRVYLRTQCEKKIEQVPAPRLWTAMRQSITVVRFIPLVVKMEQLLLHTWFSARQNFAVDTLIERRFIGRPFEAISKWRRKWCPWTYFGLMFILEGPFMENATWNKNYFLTIWETELMSSERKM